ncbi:tetratricopeptide repeat protein [Xanthomonas graminis]|uniref:hypothetical protein n=1 Tax=Xanthomonas graminis TaxID=3390026 RepID=UPI003964853B
MALQMDRDLAAAWNNLGVLALRQGDGQAAAQDYATALAVDPNPVSALSNAAILYPGAWAIAGARRRCWRACNACSRPTRSISICSATRRSGTRTTLRRSATTGMRCGCTTARTCAISPSPARICSTAMRAARTRRCSRRWRTPTRPRSRAIRPSWMRCGGCRTTRRRSAEPRLARQARATASPVQAVRRASSRNAHLLA